MTDASVSLRFEPARGLFLLDLWSDVDPSVLLGGMRAYPIAPRRWWCVAAPQELVRFEAKLAERGAVTAIDGGMRCAILTGSGWRWLLTVGGLFDSEDAAFRPGAIAATVIHHVAVWIVPIADDACEVYYPASYASSLEALWTRAIAEGVMP